MIVSLIYAMTRNRVIGRDGGLPWSLPDEMAHFRQTTLGHPVIMGRKTFDSMNRKPLPKRQNIVMSRSECEAEGIQHAIDINSALAFAYESGSQECFVIGGSAIYEAALPVADRLVETIIEAEIDGDVYFPAYDANEWLEVSRTHHPADERHEHAFDIIVRERKGVQAEAA
ncbi:MAG: dihydrofolate reductase [Gammaproteobacteria bacterium]|nr:dihydrofolate reductase [Gammaproteobacteria bacterium]